jgi:predicted HTH domain antitoxin
MGVITVRINEKDFEDLKQIEKEEKADRAIVTRKLLAVAIKQWKIKKALELLKERKITIRKAATVAEVSYVEILDLMSKDSIGLGYSLSDLKKDITN